MSRHGQSDDETTQQAYYGQGGRAGAQTGRGNPPPAGPPAATPSEGRYGAATQQHGGPPSQGFPASAPPSQGFPAPAPPPPAAKQSNGLATGGFVVALVGAVIALIPFLGIISWVISPIGLILSAVGLAFAIRRGVGKGLAIAGVVLGVLGIVICSIYAASFAAAVSGASTAAENYAPTQVAPSAPAPAETDADPNSFSGGTYVVGQDIQAGTYRTQGEGAFCGWSRNKDTTGEFGSIIANGIVQGPTTVTVKSSDGAVEFSGDCTWTKR